jgi:dihydropteroate synthase
MPNCANHKAKELGHTSLGKTTFYWGKKTYIMGVINLSPDSFSGDGLRNPEAAVAKAKRFASEKADIIDIGGESTRPGSSSISADEEMRRVIPVLESLSSEISLPLSVDTYKFEVARHALDAGANMINDIWGLKREPKLAELAAQRKIPLILMSNQRDSPPCHDDIISVVIADLQRAIEQAIAAGVFWENIIIDPGIGFGKTQEQNLELLQRLEELKTLGRPILLGSSRKSVIGWVLDLTPEQRSKESAFVPPADKRLEGTAATIAIGIAKGVDIVRVHDVREMARVCKMSDAIIRGLGNKLATVYLCLGSNLGNRMANLNEAVALLSQKVNIEKVSSVYETEPIGYKEQPLFLNMACQITTMLNPGELLHFVKGIEGEMGRVQSFSNSPRLIDIDILFYDREVIKNDELTIPHSRLAKRAFVLIPLAEIAPQLIHPELDREISELAGVVEGRKGVQKWTSGD